jgi:hypothetical protein
MGILEMLHLRRRTVFGNYVSPKVIRKLLSGGSEIRPPRTDRSLQANSRSGLSDFVQCLVIADTRSVKSNKKALTTDNRY